ncbi:MAG: hypothetical protein ACC628_18515 [Pirellulaceae bacterium]
MNRKLVTTMLLLGFLDNASFADHGASPGPESAGPDRKVEYVDAVARGAGYMPWQARGVSQKERLFRETIEQRKDALLKNRTPVEHPALLRASEIAQAKRNIASTPWGRQWFTSRKRMADTITDQPESYIERMIPELTPIYPYGFTCPNCVGQRSQEATGTGIARWNYRQPDQITCAKCGHVYPSEKYPETATLVCPRMGQTFQYYVNDQERQHPDDRSGRYAWHWVGYPVHVSFTGLIRHNQVGFMMDAPQRLAYLYALTGDLKYARRAIQILDRLAHCYRDWLYHDYWDSVADCDPMYAAYHDKSLELEWKRHLCANAFRKDTAEIAAMLQNYWGAGRVHPSTDAIGRLVHLVQAYDLLVDACDEDGKTLWQAGQRERVERNLILEYLMGAEPFVGGPGKATNVNNKSPRVYHAMAAVARCLGIAQFADTALRGYEGVRDKSFVFDGFSTESPAYTNMYLSALAYVPEQLHGFQWPEGFGKRHGKVDLYRTDARLRLMYRMLTDQLLPDGEYLPLSDTMVGTRPSNHLFELGLQRYPKQFQGRMPSLYHGRAPTEPALFHLDPREIEDDQGLNPPEMYFPAWMTAVLRHGKSAKASTLALAFSPPGGHRHQDNLTLFYAASGRTILGDLGYVGDMPVNRWLHSTQSHNLVLVEGKDQPLAGRVPRLRRMLTSELASVVEASSTVYEVCRDYRRLVLLVKGPDGKTFAVDVFYVKGGSRHEYRLFSELASSDTNDGALIFEKLVMPEEPPIPEIGTSLAKEDIFGLRDIRVAEAPPPSWQAIWKEPNDRFRVWFLGRCDRVEASNGPGQETRHQAGRRVRYLNVVRQGDDLESAFVAVHEPADLDGNLPISHIERLAIPERAGPDAVALRIESAWGKYLFLSGFEHEAHVAGVRFQGAFGLLHEDSAGRRRLLASESVTMKTEDGFGYENATALWSGSMAECDAMRFVADTDPPAGFGPLPSDVTNYVVAPAGDYQTGWPVRKIQGKTIEVDRFPLGQCGDFRLPNARSIEEQP